MEQVLGLAPRIIIVSAVAVTVMKILGNQGILITIAILAALLVALYFYQNKLLYMPGSSFLIQTSQGQRIPLKTTPRVTGIRPSMRLRQWTWR